MRFFSVFFILMLLSDFYVTGYAQDIYKDDWSEAADELSEADGRRVGLDEIKKIARTVLEASSIEADPDFRLNAGDTVSISFSGKLQAEHALVINDDGYIIIPLLGRVKIASLTLHEARDLVKKTLDEKYANVDMEMRLVSAKNISVMILGNVENPGPYMVSPYCRVIEIVARAGGPNAEGSLSDIRVIRNKELTVSFDAYAFFIKGDQSKNIRLKQGDTVFVPHAENMIRISGDVRYPGIYEMAKDMKLISALDRAGGMLRTELKRKVYVLRVNPENTSEEIFKEIIFEQPAGVKDDDNVILKDGDRIIVTTIFDSSTYARGFFSKVNIKGDVLAPGEYMVKEGEGLNSLVKRAGGLKPSGFAQGAVFTRKSVSRKQKSILESFIREQQLVILNEEVFLANTVMADEERRFRMKILQDRRSHLGAMASRYPNGRIIIDLRDILEGKSDIILEPGDSVYIPVIPNWVAVEGAVCNPQSVIFKEGETCEYYLNLVGGPTRFADEEEIYIIKADGRAESKRTGLGKIMRGDMIVVPVKM